MNSQLHEWIKNIPKVDLHTHLDGSLRVDTLLELFPEDISREELLRRVVAPEKCTSEDALGEYLQSFDVTLKVMQTKEALSRISRELCEDAAAENVKYMEVRYAPIFHQQESLTLEEIVESVLDGLNDGKKFGIESGLILCCMRHQGPDVSKKIVELAVDFMDRGVVGVDLAGGEIGNPPEVHKEAFSIAKKSGLSITIHAGEVCCPENIRKSIEMGATRIGHGVYLNEDLYDIVRDNEVALELCPTSNIQMGVKDFKAHPLKEFYDNGLFVTINTDNRLVSNTTMTNEIYQMAIAHNLSKDDIIKIVLNGMKAAFVDSDKKEELLNQFKNKLC